LLDNELFNKGYLEFLWNHGVVSDEVWANILSNGSFALPDDLLYSLADRTLRGAKIDCFNIYAPICLQLRNGTHYSSSYVS
jgi:serine carboxypeptidase-like clade 2